MNKQTQLFPQRHVWTARLKPGAKADYIRLHRDLPPEMADLLRSAGIHNYSIWCADDRLFGYFEATRGLDAARAAQAESPVFHQWNETMRELIEVDLDPATGKPRPAENLFYQP